MNNDDSGISAGMDLAWNTINLWVQGFYRLLPNIAAAVLILGIFLIIGFMVRLTTRQYFKRQDRIDLGAILSAVGFWFFTILGLGIALTILMPSVKPGNLVASVGFGSIALGFVFKEIFQNWFAGLLILLRLPFRRGDQITVGDVEGTVIRIEPRATIVRTYDNRDIVVPNSTIYQSNVMVHTSQPMRRMEIDLTVGYSYDIRVITRIIENSLAQVEEIFKDPAPQVLCWDLGGTSLGIKVRWWVKPERAQVIIARARAVQAIKEAFDANDIDPTDPQLIYYRENKAGDAVKHDRDDPLQTVTDVKSGPCPPEFEMDVTDPETDSAKIDDKKDTLLAD